MEVLKRAREIKCRFKCPMCRSIIGASKVEMDQVCEWDGGIPSWSLMCPNCDNHITLFSSDVDEAVIYEDKVWDDGPSIVSIEEDVCTNNIHE
jgi:hypothetical protein